MLASPLPPDYSASAPWARPGAVAQRLAPSGAATGVHSVSMTTIAPQALLGNGYGSANVAVNGEEISTIFVVGFPEDMQEREFQNMFVFCVGFEAATLKIPTFSAEDVDPLSGSMANPRKQIVSGPKIRPPQAAEEAGPDLGCRAIGFAKFRTRLDALEARDVLSGRKVDAEKGSVLKAEMAKKNLHTKRGLSNEQYFSSAFSPAPWAAPHMQGGSPLISPAVTRKQSFQPLPSIICPPVMCDAFCSFPATCSASLPSGLLMSPQDPGTDRACGLPANLCAASTDPNAVVGSESEPTASSASADAPDYFGLPSDSLRGLWKPNQENSSDSSDYGDHQLLRRRRPSINAQFSAPRITRLEPVGPPLLQDAPVSTPQELWSSGAAEGGPLSDLGSALQSAPPNETQSFHSSVFASGAAGLRRSAGYEGHSAGPSVASDLCSSDATSPPPQPLSAAGLVDGSHSARFEHLSINTAAANGPLNVSGAYAPLGTSAAGTALSPSFNPSSTNPGDQNPPCNTLYVGNLPLNTNEEELCLLFSRRRGYKRMCFKPKANGPMCFVEFDDVVCSTQGKPSEGVLRRSFVVRREAALHDLQGIMLANSVKNGVRLSYSKNPLGVRQQQPPQQQPPQQHAFPSLLAVPSSSLYIPNGPLSPPPVPYNGPQLHRRLGFQMTRAVMAGVSQAGLPSSPAAHEGVSCGPWVRDSQTLEGTASGGGTESPIWQAPDVSQQQLKQQQQSHARQQWPSTPYAISSGLAGPGGCFRTSAAPGTAQHNTGTQSPRFAVSTFEFCGTGDTARCRPRAAEQEKPLPLPLSMSLSLSSSSSSSSSSMQTSTTLSSPSSDSVSSAAADASKAESCESPPAARMNGPKTTRANSANKAAN
ncbi:MAG: hypothetical protein BJ554DRAFT_614 [Olpidium bornovanus]|uniref:RRM domain-containing protein n=1 Tax=Olpidium bornovanus TaxID=278681 RepID=A0A8H7ZTG9_9FUNG|nr:MAG: hypothetical protein BJ554DRAFT_614 [Olpidium bornovanus]